MQGRPLNSGNDVAVLRNKVELVACVPPFRSIVVVLNQPRRRANQQTLRLVFANFVFGLYNLLPAVRDARTNTCRKAEQWRNRQAQRVRYEICAAFPMKTSMTGDVRSSVQRCPPLDRRLVDESSDGGDAVAPSLDLRNDFPQHGQRPATSVVTNYDSTRLQHAEDMRSVDIGIRNLWVVRIYIAHDKSILEHLQFSAHTC